MIDLQPACLGMIEVVQRVTDDQLTLPSPCTEYDVGDLIDHVDVVARGATALAHPAGLTDGNPGGGVVRVGADWRDRFGRQLDALGRAWNDPAVIVAITGRTP